MLLVSRVEALRVCECFIVSLCFLALVAEVSKKVTFFYSPWGFESEAKELVFDDLRMWVFMVLISGLPLQVCKVSGFWFLVFLFVSFVQSCCKVKVFSFCFCFICNLHLFY